MYNVVTNGKNCCCSCCRIAFQRFRNLSVYIFRGVFIMKKFVAFIFALVLCLSMTITAFATDYDSPGGGDNTEETASPQTGSAAVVLLAGAACAAGGISAVSFKKSR